MTALELEPFSLIINREMTYWLIYAKRFEQALVQNKKDHELFPEDVGFHAVNATIYYAQGKYPQAYEEFFLSAKANKNVTPEDLQKAKEAYEKGGWDSFSKMVEEISSCHH